MASFGIINKYKELGESEKIASGTADDSVESDDSTADEAYYKPDSYSFLCLYLFDRIAT